LTGRGQCRCARGQPCLALDVAMDIVSTYGRQMPMFSAQSFDRCLQAMTDIPFAAYRACGGIPMIETLPGVGWALPTVLVDLECQAELGEFTRHRQRPPGAFLDAVQPVAHGVGMAV
jgi:hypothetical protein